MGSEQRHRIRDALLGNDDALIQTYRTSAAFKNALDSFAAMLPSMILGLANQCLKEDGDRHLMMRALLADQMNSRVIRPEDVSFVDMAVDHGNTPCSQAHPGRPHLRPARINKQEKPGVQRDANG